MPGRSIALRTSGRGPASGGSRLQYATLRIFASVPPSKGGSVGAGGSLGDLAFQFNPKEMSIQKSAKWARSTAPKATKAGPPEFQGSEPCKLTLEMFVDATDTYDSLVVDRVETLFSCTVPMADTKDAWPPLVVLQWGGVSSFLGYVSSVQAKYTLFAPDGTPLRAVCAVTVEEVPDQAPKQNPTSGTLAVHSRHTLTAGESLASVAYAEYGDPALWRPLAAFNGIDDPLRVRPGTALAVPERPALLAAGDGQG